MTEKSTMWHKTQNKHNAFTKIVSIVSGIFHWLSETKKVEKCFSHTPLGPGAGIRSRDTKGGQFFLLLSAIT